MTGIMSDEPETNTTAPQHQQQSQNTNDIQQRLTTARNTTTLQKGKRDIWRIKRQHSNTKGKSG